MGSSDFGAMMRDALYRLVARAPFGERRATEKRVCQAMGRSARCLRRPLRRLGVDELSRALKELGVDPVFFLEEAGLTALVGPLLSVRADGDPLRAFCDHAALLARRYGEPPALMALRRLKAVGEPSPGTLAALREVDTLRARDPGSAAARAESLAAGARDVITAAHVCASWASALRRSRLSQAAMVLAFAIEVALEHDRPRLLADCSQRAVYIAGDQGRHEHGIVLADRCLAIRMESGTLGQVGQTFVERGVMQLKLGRYAQALPAYELALASRMDSEPYVFAANHGLAYCNLQLGNLEQAEHFTREAEAAQLTIGSYRGDLLWLKASLAAAKGELDAAERFYHETLEEFGRAQPGNTLLIAAELVRVLLLQGRARDACRYARSLNWLAIPLEDEPVLAAFHVDLIRAGLEGERALSVALVEKVIAGIKSGQDTALPAG